MSPRAEKEIKACVEAMLEPDPSTTWAIPRMFPTDVCPINYDRTVNLDSPNGVVIECTPDLFETLKISSRPNGAVTPINLRGAIDYSLVALARNDVRWYPEYTFYDASGNVVLVPSFLVDDPLAIALVTQEATGGISTVTALPRQKRIYAAQITAYDTTSLTVQFVGFPTSLTQTFEVLDLNLSVLYTDSAVTASPSSGVQYNNALAIAGSGPFFTCGFSFQTPASSPITMSSISALINNTTMVIDTVHTGVYGPSPDVSGALYQSVVDSSDKYSFPLLSLLCTFTGSDLLNGGNIAIGVVPSKYNLSLIPAVAYAQICALGGHRYSGAMKNGVHGFYIPDDITRVSFFPIGTPIEGRRLCVAILPQQIGGGGPSSAATFRISLRSHIEFINASQSLAHLTCGCGYEEIVESMFSCLQVQEQVGENPDHLKRIAKAAMTVAKDPRTKQLAATALKWIGRGALASVPLLLA